MKAFLFAAALAAAPVLASAGHSDDYGFPIESSVKRSTYTPMVRVAPRSYRVARPVVSTVIRPFTPITTSSPRVATPIFRGTFLR